MSTVIKVENLGKQYNLAQVGTGTVTHDINRWWHKIRGKEDPYLKVGETNDRTKKGSSDLVWALKDINFEVKQGDVLGIIGKNGAGKSTLLKILSRVTGPTIGDIKVKGRIAALLEVGTGFNPELSGRENIFLNGAILGMTKQEIKKKFDEIVDFSGVERYIDTPVKRYSSGMYVRLAFAVAAHLEPEILIVDEVLAVGDAEFQKKCLGKMKDVSGQGRTVLFVSHNITAVKDLCKKGVVLTHGNLSFMGSADKAALFYQKGIDSSTYYKYQEGDKVVGNAKIQILEFSVEPVNADIIAISSEIKLYLKFKNYSPKINLAVSCLLKNYDEIIIAELGNIITSENDSEIGIYEVEATIPGNILNFGSYYFDVFFGENQKHVLFSHSHILNFEIKNEAIGANVNGVPGILRLNLGFKNSFTKQI